MPTRVYVQSGVYDKFAEMMREATQQNIRIGHGSDPSTTMGPLTTSPGIKKLEHHVPDAVSHGGKILFGGKRPANVTGSLNRLLCLT